ncbi:MAG: TrkH family potassium uptake protein [Planctomycetota bacterium]|nr:MAG: TrkH family potassium uptake protein [Planctomycetota bacterium]
MVKFSSINYTLGGYLIFYSCCFLPPLGIALAHQEWRQGVVFATIFASTLLVGLLCWGFGYSRREQFHISKKEGLLIVSLIWILSGILGAIPFYFCKAFPSFISSLFESISGFTTTGSSILTNIEALPKSILFWRSFTHWLGGLGVVVLFLAILPYLGVEGRILFRSEVPGPEADVLKPKVQETALALLKIYLAFTLLETLLLLLCGMNLFDALCHTFGTLATGGFSTKNSSIAHYNSVAVEIVIIVFMILAGANFSLYYHFLYKEKNIFLKDSEFKTYILILLLFTTLITLNLTLSYHPNLWRNLRHAAFQVVSIQTTTGYGTADFAQWPPFSKIALLLLMFIGGCAGSTGGGIKVVRWMIVFKIIYHQIEKTFRPHAVRPICINQKGVSEKILEAVMGLFCLWLLIFALSSLLLSALGVDILTATSATAATLNNIGPGLGQVGPTLNFSTIPELGKLWLSLCMLLGRLEIFTLIILFHPAYWKQ